MEGGGGGGEGGGVGVNLVKKKKKKLQVYTRLNVRETVANCALVSRFRGVL